jgi:hypothetical protein
MIAALTTLLLALGASSQDALPAPGSAEVAPQGTTTPALPAPERTRLAAGLSQVDLDARLTFLDGLLAELPGSPDRARQLEGWLAEVAAGGDELAWTARLVQRQLSRTGTFMDLAQQLEVRLLDDPLFGRGDGDGLFTEAWSFEVREPQVLFLEGPGGGQLPAELLDREHQLQIEAWIAGKPGGPVRYPVASLEALGDCTLELRIGPDWARLRLLEAPEAAPEASPGSADPEGGAQHLHQDWITRVREYQGRSLAQIVSRNPDLVGLLPFEVPGVLLPADGPRTDVLGVFTRALTPERCSLLGLEPGCGLEVLRVEPGTVAEVLGIAPGSVVLEVCGIEVLGLDGIRVAMAGGVAHHGSEGGLCVVWVDAFGRTQSRTWRRGEPVPVETAAPVAEPSTPGPGLRPVDR